MKAAAALLLALGAASCGGELQRLETRVERVQQIVHGLECGDGAPARVLTDARCRDGICGLSCAPDRWVPTKEE